MQFTITAKGDNENIRFIKSVCCDIDDEIVSALKNTNGMWNAGFKNDNGEKVDRPYEISLAFCCTNESSKPVNVVFKERAIEYFGRANKALYEKHDTKKAMSLFSSAITYFCPMLKACG